MKNKLFIEFKYLMLLLTVAKDHYDSGMFKDAFRNHTVIPELKFQELHKIRFTSVPHTLNNCKAQNVIHLYGQ